MEETISQPKKGISSTTGILIALLAAIIAGAAVWAYYQYKVLPDLNTKPTVTIPVFSKPFTPAASATSTTATTTANWKTYANSTYGFSFKYPTNLYVKFQSNANPDQGPIAESTISISDNQTITQSDIYSKLIYIDIFPASSSSTITQPNGMDPVSSSNTTVGGVTAKKYVSSDGSFVYVFVKNQRQYQIGIGANISSTLKANFNNILSTFQFTK
jgi:hypothetical protein